VHEFADVVNVCLAGTDAGPVAAEVAVRLRQAVANHETYSFSNEELLTALLEAQPAAVLEALFSGSEEDQQAGVRVFDHLGDRRSKNPADAISCNALIAWCDLDPAVRYPLASSVVKFNSPVGESAPQVWSEQATALLVSALNPERVLATFIERFRPSSWTGSRAAQMEANARLLDDVGGLVPSLLQLAMAAKSQLMQEVARERQRETERDRIENERFEW
jgi:hypothetical protein